MQSPHLYALAENTSSSKVCLIHSDDSGSTWSAVVSDMCDVVRNSSIDVYLENIYFSNSYSLDQNHGYIGRHVHASPSGTKIDVKNLLSLTGTNYWQIGPIKALDENNIYFVAQSDVLDQCRLYHFNGNWSGASAGDFTLLDSENNIYQCVDLYVVAQNDIYLATEYTNNNPYYPLLHWNGSTLSPNGTWGQQYADDCAGIQFYDGEIYLYTTGWMGSDNYGAIYKGSASGGWTKVLDFDQNSMAGNSATYAPMGNRFHIDQETGYFYICVGVFSGIWRQYLLIYDGNEWGIELITSGIGVLAGVSSIDSEQIVCAGYTTSFDIWDGNSFTNLSPSGYGLIGNAIAFDVPVVAAAPNPGGSGTINYYCQIEGINDLYWQFSERAAITHSTRTVRTCLHVGGSFSSELDPVDLVEAPGTLSLYFDDIDDPIDHTKSYFGQLMNDVRWRTNAHTYLAEGTTPNEWIYPTDNSIDVMDSTQLAASGDAFLGWETINYTGKSSNTLTGVTRGKYPAIDGALGAQAYPKAMQDSRVINTPVCSKPYFFTGRRIAIYKVTWDSATGSWSSGSLFWVGKVTEFKKIKTQWTVVCENILAELDRPVLKADFPKTELAPVINNLYNADEDPSGNPTLELNEEVYNAKWESWHVCKVTIPSGVYRNLDAFAKAINAAIASAMSAASFVSDFIGLKRLVAMPHAEVWHLLLKTTSAYETRVRFAVNGANKHWWRAFGFQYYVDYLVTDGDGLGSHVAKNLGAKGYHPGYPGYNGNKLYVSNDPFVNQGDCIASNEYTGGFVEIEGTRVSDQVFTFHQIFTGSSSDSIGTYLTLAGVNEKVHSEINIDSHVSFTDINAAAPIDQVLVGYSDHLAGPFSMILRILKSSGSRGWNGDEDVLHSFCGANFPAAIIDEASFYKADSEVKNTPLSDRSYCVFTKKDTLIDIIRRECQLFGYWLGWRNGQLTLRRITPPRWNEYVHTIDESNILTGWTPEIEQSSIEANCYKFKLRYDVTKKKFRDETFEINLANAIQAHGKKSVDIEHPGVNLPPVDDIEAYLIQNVSDRYLFAYKKPMVSVPLAYELLNDIFVGDVAVFEHDRVIDPYGSGQRAASAYAIVKSVEFDLRTQEGEVSLIIDDVKNKEKPWGPSALVDASATNAGWDSVNNRLTLIDVQYGKKTQNLLKYSEDIDQSDYTKTLCTTANDDEVIPDNSTTSGQYIEQDVTWIYPNRYGFFAFEIDVTNSDCDYIIAEIEDQDGNTWETYFNISSGDNEYIYCSSAQSHKYGCKAVDNDSDWVRCWIGIRFEDVFLQSQTLTIRLYPSDSASSQAYNGDGSTVAFYVRKLQVAQSDRPPTYVQTTSAIVPSYADDTDDGERFQASDEILVIERSPADPTSPTVFGPLTVSSDYETDGAQLLTLDDAIPSWDNTKEYVVVFADYDDGIAATQDDRATYFAADASNMVDTDYPYHW